MTVSVIPVFFSPCFKRQVYEDPVRLLHVQTSKFS